MDLKELRSRMELAIGRRRLHENAVQEISDLCMPYRGDITTKRAPGQDRTNPKQGTFDSVAIHSADKFVNFLKATIFPSNQQWLLTVPAGGERAPVKTSRLLDSVSMKILNALAASNFYNPVDNWIGDAGVLGTGTFYGEWMKNKLVFNSIPWGNSWFMTGKDDMPIFNVVARDMPLLSAKRAWKNLGDQLEKRYAENAMDVERFYHVTFQNENGIAGKLSLPEGKPWISIWCHMDTDDKSRSLNVLDKKGQDWNPYIVSRWKVVDNEEYGRGQGHIARPDVKGVNKMKELVYDAAGVDLKPPFMVEDETAIDLDLGPSGLIVVRPPQQMNPTFITSGARYDVADKIAREDKQAVKEAFLGDLIDDPQTQDRSAAAVRDRQFRASQRLAPRADRIFNEMVLPLAELTMNLLAVNGQLPELKQLRAQGLKHVEFKIVSPFFTAQKSDSLFRAQAWYNDLLEKSQLVGPEILDNVNKDEYARLTADLGDIPALLLNEEKDVKRIREERAEALRQQQLAEAQAQSQEQDAGASAESFADVF